MSGESGASLDKILLNYVGGVGKYQFWNTLAMTWVYYAGLFPLFLTVFTVYVPAHRCKVPYCEMTNQSKITPHFEDQNWLNFTLPIQQNSQDFFGQKRTFDSCKMFKRLDINVQLGQEYTCFPEDFSDNETVPCQDFLYEAGYFQETLATKLDLVCDKSNLKNLLDTILILGLLFGSLAGGRIGDKFGRKRACFLAIASIVPSTIIAGFVQSYIAYACFHLITMTCLPVIWVNAYVYATEIFTPNWRYIFIGLFELPFGYYIYNLIAYLNTSWSYIHLWTGIVTALVLPLYFVLPESARWLAQNNQEDQAMSNLLLMAKINGKTLNPQDEAKMKELVLEIAKDSHVTEDTLTPLDMFRQGHAIKSLILVFAWITSCISFYALSLNSSDLNGDIMLNFFLSRTSGFLVAFGILLIANYFGRTKSLVASHTCLGLACIGLAFIPKENINAVRTVYVLANVVASISKRLELDQLDGWLSIFCFPRF